MQLYSQPLIRLLKACYEKNSKMPFGFTITRKGERLIASKYQALSK